MTSRSPLSSFSLLAILCFLFTISLPQAFGQAPGGGTGVIGAGGYVQDQIAIATFDVVGSGGRIKPGYFRDTIYRDLTLLSNFLRVQKPQSFVEENHKLDVKNGSVDIREWQRLGAHYVLKGRYSVEGSKLKISYWLFNVTYGTQAASAGYETSLTRPQKVAHLISDDIVRDIEKDAAVPLALTQLAFVSKRSGQQHRELYVMGAAGDEQTRLTFNSKGAATPCWGRNSSEIYFMCYKDSNTDLCGFQLGTRKEWFISRRPQLNFAPDFNEKLQRIVLTLGFEGNDEIYTMSYTGQTKTLQRLTRASKIDTSPSWSPSGRQIVFNSGRGGSPQIYMMDANGTNVKRLSRQPRYSYNSSPVWSPKGDRIAFQGQVSDGKFHIFTMDLNGNNWRQLTSGYHNNEDPTWAPDGNHIAFTSNRTGTDQIFLMRADGKMSPQQLTTQGINQSPSWSRLPKKVVR